MRTIFLLRGAPGSGKSTWIKENNLTPYTICADDIRLLYTGPVVNTDGNLAISQDCDTAVWRTLNERLEERMDRGEFLIVDATHYRAALLQQYKKLISKYRYRAYVVDFTDIPKEVTLQRNKCRDKYKFVPESVIEKMYAVFESDFKEVSNKFKIITREEAIKMVNDSLLYDFNEYKRIFVFGDIHGCYEPIKKFFEENPYKEENAYIFVGDYLDRGIQNDKVMEFLLESYNKPNFMFLEGNHERWIRLYGEDEKTELTPEQIITLKTFAKDAWYRLEQRKIKNYGFIKNTSLQLEQFDKKNIRMLCRKFMQMAYFKFRNKRYFITHGGIGCLPNLKIATNQMIQGVGKYEDVDKLYDAWVKNTEEDCILIHGHRNTFNIPAKQKDGRCYNLDSKVEYGNPLRILKITDKTIRVLYYDNPVFDENLKQQRVKLGEVKANSNNELINALNESKLVHKKLFGNGVVSYNFTRKAFNDRKWNQLTCTARGLFIRGDKVVARSYDKFFNWGERPETATTALNAEFKFPVTAYRKENGFLALISSLDGKLLVCSKSSLSGTAVDIINKHLKSLTEDAKNYINDYCQKNNCTFVFECVDPIQDPHIVKYDKGYLYLLDIVKNELEYENTPYKEVERVAKEIGVCHKQIEKEFTNWDELYSYRKQLDKTLNPLTNDFIEGVVFVDSNNFMVKYKTPTYSWWKRKRSIMESLVANHNVKPVYIDQNDIKIFSFMNSLKNDGSLDSMNIIQVRDKFIESQNNE